MLTAAGSFSFSVPQLPTLLEYVNLPVSFFVTYLMLILARVNFYCLLLKTLTLPDRKCLSWVLRHSKCSINIVIQKIFTS